MPLLVLYNALRNNYHMAEISDVIIIGGGIIGNSIASHLAGENENENLKITVVNSSNLGMPSSIAAAGLLTPFQLNELENHMLKDFCYSSFEYFPKFLESINSNTDLGFKQSGSLYLIFSNLEIAQKESELKGIKNAGVKTSFLNKQEVTKIEPFVTKEILGAYYFPTEGFINNVKFLKAIIQHCIEKKVNYLNKKVSEIKIVKDKIEGIVLENGEIISGKKYVLCNGSWSNLFLKKLLNTNEDLIKPVKGEILQVETVHELNLPQKIIFCQEGYLVPRLRTNQFEKDSILIGSTSEEVKLEENHNIFQNTVSGILSLTNLFKKLVPSYEDFSITNMWAGLRPKTKDSLPILGQIPDIENLYCALGHYRNGILMGPLTGKVMKDLILENTIEFNIAPFKIDRFIKNRDIAYNIPTTISMH